MKKDNKQKQKEKPAVKPAKDKNASKKVPDGRTVKTKDKYLPIDKKGKSDNLKEKRLIAVIDSNSNDELAVVKLTTQKQKNTSELPTYKRGNGKATRFKNFVEIKDNEGNPIKIDGIRFIENGKQFDLSVSELKKIRKQVLNHCVQSSENRKKISELKARTKDKKKR